MIAGGGEIYALAMTIADHSAMSRMSMAELEGDTCFPAIDPRFFELVRREEPARGERDSDCNLFFHLSSHWRKP